MHGHNKRDAGGLSDTTRREFCADLMLTSAGLMLAANVRSVAAAQDSVAAYPPRRIEGAEFLLPGSGLYFDYPTRNDPAVLLRSSDGEYRAFSRRCSHAGCSVEYDPPERCLKCPCHQGAYDSRMGHVMFGPPRRPLDIIALQVRAGGYIWAIGKSVGRDSEVITQSLRGGE
ncbi:MAG TPA: Rieske (2Fe-2S) protein [Pyrinomonadaceae bacterium]|jgi:Rieske Fe-S protein|nr:Rieske (2Fe-2S) protein [Pyrinomonadaceae bacterium]